jgi:tungstate transport system permease protein
VAYLLDGFVKAWVLLLTGHPETYSAVAVSLKTTTLSIAGSLAAGLPAGFCLAYFTFPGKRFLRTLVDTLLALPTVVVGLLVYAFVTYRGPLGKFGLLFSIPGMAIAQVILVFPIVVALTATAVESLDRRFRPTLLSLGARGGQLLLATLSESRFAVLTAAVTAFGRAISEVGASMMIGGNIKWHTRTITTAIALETGKGEFAMGVALGIVLLLLAFVVNWALVYLRRRTQW